MRFHGLIYLIIGFLMGVGVTPATTDSPQKQTQKVGHGSFQPLATGPVELGRVNWLRRFDLALERSAALQKPMLVLFQEVPGCSTSTAYGREVLSHPLLVEAIETHFVPVAVYNNVQGSDRIVLEQFGEPAWNNPVVRIVNPDRTPLAPRLSGDYTISGLARTLVTALKAHQKKVPPYLQLLDQEARAQRTGLELAVFGMPCFWSGEAALGAIDGVIETLPGFMGSEEVVAAWYDPSRIDYGRLIGLAHQTHEVRSVFYKTPVQAEIALERFASDRVHAAREFRADNQPQYYLRQTVYGRLPLTAMQAVKINAALVDDQEDIDPGDFLSPRQHHLVTLMTRHDDLPWSSMTTQPTLEKAWDRATALLAK